MAALPQLHHLHAIVKSQSPTTTSTGYLLALWPPPLNIQHYVATAAAAATPLQLYKELACPLDGFQLLLFSLGGADGKLTVLCPYCYNHPPFLEGGEQGGGRDGGMPCSQCAHPACRHSVRKSFVAVFALPRAPSFV
jgi:hypothetical protein